jgi:hypothetical protein
VLKEMFSDKKTEANSRPHHPFDEKPLKVSGIWENFVQAPPFQCT